MQKGTKFGRYTIEKKLGEGGMGEVYLAFDNSLERFVALKILSEAFSQDADRVQRLKQEAKAASALNHPNILTIYEIGTTDNIEFIAMEFVEGKTLREVIEGGELTLKDAVKIAEQIADGLCVAHKVRLVHRDIKPENIILRDDGYVRILDFGLAKPTLNRRGDTATQRAGEEDKTLIADLPSRIHTAPGVVMGSVQYMSPEQARGLTVDERSDVWSLGIVLYEMVAGKTPFAGETVSDSLANLIHLPPKPLTDFLPDAPFELQNIIGKSLQKNLDERYQTIREMTADLKNLRRELETNPADGLQKTNYSPTTADRIFSEETKTRIYQTDESKADETVANPPLPQKITLPDASPNQAKSGILRYVFGAIAALLLIGGIGLFAAKFFGGNNSKTDLFANPQISKLSDDGKSRLPTISPDGRYVAFQSGDAGAKNITVRQLLTGSAVEIVPKSGLAVLVICFSPDTNYVYFVRSDDSNTVNSLYQVPTLGGTPKLIVSDIDSNITFSPDGTKIAFTRHSGNEGTDTLLTANIDGTNEKPIIATPQTAFGYLGNPAWSPTNADKIAVLVSTFKGGESDSISLAEVSLESGKLSLLANGKWANLSDVGWQKDGDGFFALGSEKSGDPAQVWKISYPGGERKRLTNDTNFYFWLGVSGDNKTLITVKSQSSASIWNFTPATKNLKQISEESVNLNGGSGIAVKPDGNLIVSRHREADIDFWEISPDGKDVQIVISAAKLNADPKLSPDGTKICFMSNRSNVWRVWTMDADGKNARQATTVGDEVNQFSPNFADDGKIILYCQQEKNSGVTKLMKVAAEGGIPEKVFNNDGNESAVSVSPDGKHLFFYSLDAAYKKTFHAFSLDGGQIGTAAESSFEMGAMDSIKWSPDGKSLTYINREGIPNIWRTSLDGKQKKQLTDFTGGRIFKFAWSQDGKQIFISRGTVNNEMILIKDDAK